MKKKKKKRIINSVKYCKIGLRKITTFSLISNFVQIKNSKVNNKLMGVSCKFHQINPERTKPQFKQINKIAKFCMKIPSDNIKIYKFHKIKILVQININKKK